MLRTVREAVATAWRAASLHELRARADHLPDDDHAHRLVLLCGRRPADRRGRPAPRVQSRRRARTARPARRPGAGVASIARSDSGGAGAWPACRGPCRSRSCSRPADRSAARTARSPGRRSRRRSRRGTRAGRRRSGRAWRRPDRTDTAADRSCRPLLAKKRLLAGREDELARCSRGSVRTRSWNTLADPPRRIAGRHGARSARFPRTGSLRAVPVDTAAEDSRVVKPVREHDSRAVRRPGGVGIRVR